ncbi:hypothetical protein BWI17_13570 [Betaproteobacteria bacterium GR16-43]|nr:hypothetical protein BWI17_13570 [Betaproteobacteria bacterium GR16-43]
MRWAFWRREPTAFLRAVHYFGRTQPLNFWDSAILSEVPAHLEQIRGDGFNTIIVVVPWRGFQRTVVPSTFDEVNLDRLRQLLIMTQQAGLRFIVRVSFPWNSDPKSEGGFDERILGLFSRHDVRRGWLAYLREIRRISEAFDGFQFAFFSWEDMPSIREHMIYRTEKERLALARVLGYQAYLASRFDIAKVSEMFGKPFASMADVPIPSNDCEGYRTYHDFVNEALDSLLASGRAAWPRLAMQVRVDFDRLQLGGQNEWLENDIRIDDTGMRATYFFPAMYAQDHETVLPAAKVLSNLEHVMRRLSDEGRNTRHFLDQFIFHDESAQLHAWTRVQPDEMGDYLVGAAPLLRRYSCGFGFWNYFDYRVNHLYNAAFLRELLGWESSGLVELGPPAEPRLVRLLPGATIAQSMHPDKVGWGTPHYETMRFAATFRTHDAATSLRLVTNGEVETEFNVDRDGRIEVEFRPDRHRSGFARFSIENVGSAAVELTDLNLWGTVYRSRIYDEDGKPGTYLEAVRAMLRE